MNRLEQLIRERIQTQGPISFRDFMAMALYEPGLGYYVRTGTEIGKEGDFYTSPHAHAVFGAMIARQAQECWNLMGRPPRFEIVEFGGGRGWLAKDILDYLRDKDFYSAVRYTLIELNPEMVKRQQSLLIEHEGIMKWATSASQAGSIRGLVLSNELVDAMPVHLIEFDGQWREVFVTIDASGRLCEVLENLSSGEIGKYVDQYLSGCSVGYRTEVNLDVRRWLGEVASMLAEGFVLTVDYGYPAPSYYDEERRQGTLLCYSSHTTNEDFLSNVGTQDITSHVNFTDLKTQGEYLGLTSIGFARQGIYLVSMGIDEVVTELYGNTPQLGRQSHMIQQLIMPGTMGDTHKVLIQHKGMGSHQLRGFMIKNELHKLS